MRYEFEREKLVNRFLKSGLSYRQFANVAQVSHSTVFRVMKHGDAPSMDALLKFCAALKLSPRSLFTARK